FAIMLLLVAWGAGNLSESHFSPLFPQGPNRVLVTAGFVFISFGGLLNIATIAGEVKDPVRNIPRGMILSVLAVTALYSAVLVVVVGLLPGETLSVSLAPVAEAGRAVFGRAGYVIISIGALLAFVTTANAGIMSASRYPLALSEDRLLPGAVGRLTPGKGTPYIAVTVTGIFIFLSLTLELSTLVKMGSVVILTLYVLTNAAVIILREGRVQNYRPAFKVPFYPWLNIAGIFLFIFLIIDMGLAAVEISLFLVMLSAGIYFFYGRKRHKIEYALLHLVERVINRKITDNTLEDELKRVIINRDDIKIDRVHRLITEAAVLDLEGKVALGEFLEKLADRVSEDIGLSPGKVIELFMEREEQGSTAITPFVAIPHIIIPGEERFKLVVARCRDGIEFNRDSADIKAVFVLFGTKDERSFHLKVLSAVAHIVQSPDFEKAWLSARDENQLRDILLLSERSR
ncbi:MAG: amino acid permease, partial [Candidatus Omnitrophica bacterium]|nr:amino acid permease [Candidatus Omnitrophota bacterium]